MKVNGIDGVAAQICFVRISESVTDDRASEGTRVEVVDRGVMLGRATPTGARQTWRRKPSEPGWHRSWRREPSAELAKLGRELINLPSGRLSDPFPPSAAPTRGSQMGHEETAPGLMPGGLL